jgi:regulator of replication initiation timing
VSEIGTKLAWLEEQLEMMLLAVRDLKAEWARQNGDNSRKTEQVKVQQTIGEGHANLARLYQEGYHICPMHFGSQRDGEECLFCAGLLRRGRNNKDTGAREG